MAKANKKIREATLGGVNWWDYLTSIRPKGHRNEPQYLDYRDVKNKTELVKITNKLIKMRKRVEIHMHNIYSKYSKYQRESIADQRTKRKQPTKIQKSHNQIQYGFDLVKWWNEQHE